MSLNLCHLLYLYFSFYSLPWSAQPHFVNPSASSLLSLSPPPFPFHPRASPVLILIELSRRVSVSSVSRLHVERSIQSPLCTVYSLPSATLQICHRTATYPVACWSRCVAEGCEVITFSRVGFSLWCSHAFLPSQNGFFHLFPLIHLLISNPSNQFTTDKMTAVGLIVAIFAVVEGALHSLMFCTCTVFGDLRDQNRQIWNDRGWDILSCSPRSKKH